MPVAGRRLKLLRWPQRLPAHVLSGITTALGITVVHVAISALAGPHAAQLSTSGSIFASLADTPGTPGSIGRRVLLGALLGCTAALLTALLDADPLTLGVGIAVITFGSTMLLAWGPRAGPASFAGVLAIIFTMALPAAQAPRQLLAWNVAGAFGYLAWAVVIGAALQWRYRTLAVASALSATAGLLRLRAELLASIEPGGSDADRLQRWVRAEAALAERLQSARDLLFAAPDTPRVRRETSVLLRTIELREVLLASRLDIDLLGDDRAAGLLRRRIAERLRALAAGVDASQAALRGVAPLRAVTAMPALHAASSIGDNHEASLGDVGLAAADPRSRLLPALDARLQQLGADVERIAALLRGECDSAVLTRAELRLFVAPEGWPLKALRGHLSLASPVLRHALRAGLALGAAYAIARSLPWASHPQWLVLSVAVVLRGNLEQTLARRNLRVVGTLFGCLAMLALLRISSAQLLMVVFIVAAGVAHGYAVERYLVTAAAATVMSLLQAHLVNPTSGFPIAERVADTLLGALLAWGFSYVLPSWERRGLPEAIARALRALCGYASQALSADGGRAVAQRLARRQAYDALGALATALQRSAAEPARVRPPVVELALLLDHGQRLMAHLSVIRLSLARSDFGPHRLALASALEAADAGLMAALAPPSTAAAVVAGLADAHDAAASAEAAAAVAAASALARVPIEPPAQDWQPWLLRRLDVAVHDALQVRKAAQSALSLLAASPDRSH